MIIKVCGMREPDNIRDVVALGIDMVGLVFNKKSSRYVALKPSHAGLLPDYAGITVDNIAKWNNVVRVGVFGNDMPQNIITMAYNYKLDYIQLNGIGDEIMIDNLRRTLDRDICPGIKFIKAIGLADIHDVDLWRRYKDVADILLFYAEDSAFGDSDLRFDWSLLDGYDGDIPFIISGGIGPDDAERILAVSHPKMVGVNLNRCFESSPGIKDVGLLRKFIDEIRRR